MIEASSFPYRQGSRWSPSCAQDSAFLTLARSPCFFLDDVVLFAGEAVVPLPWLVTVVPCEPLVGGAVEAPVALTVPTTPLLPALVVFAAPAPAQKDSESESCFMLRISKEKAERGEPPQRVKEMEKLPAR